MKNLKRLLGLMLLGTMLLVLGACGGQDQAATPSENQQTTPPANTDSTEPSATEPEATGSTTDASGSNVLVVYYSATGNTEEVANYIAGATEGDVFELEPAEPYSDADLDWTDESSRVNAEHEDPSLRDVELVADTVENWDSYDTVFVGYPIWWGIAAWPVDSFIEANDFTGKTVIPFCTSSSSGLGESGELLAELAGTGQWLEGMRFPSGADEADVIEWVDSLEINS